MLPVSEKNKRRDSKKRYKGYPYGNKKGIRKSAARAARRLGVMSNSEYKKSYDVWWTLW